MSHYRPYPAYRDSGVDWIGSVPVHWTVVPLKTVAKVINGATPDSTNPDYWDGDIAWYTPADIDNEIATILGEPKRRITREGLASCAAELCPPGTIILSTRAPIGSIGITASAAATNQGCRSLVTSTGVSNQWLASVLTASRRELAMRGNGTTFQELSTDALRSLRTPMPPKDECVAVSASLERETARIDAVIAKKTRFVDLVSMKMLAMAGQMTGDSGCQWARLQHLVEIISRPVNQRDGEAYTRLGLYNRGRGIFKKKEADNEDMGESDFFWIKRGDLILSGQFAWEGAVALAGVDHEGCVVSHRFPVITGKSPVVLTEYLYAILLTDYGDFILNECSRGSAGRNRPLNLSLLLKWKVPVPSLEYQERIARLVALRDRIQKKTQQSIDLLKQRRSALITAAVTGKIDLRSAA